MRHLPLDGFRRASRFLKTEARALDRAVFELRFQGRPAERVADELASYQNADGGFGHALEPDVRTPTSSPLATGIGLGILKELGRPASDTMVIRAVEYVVETWNPDTRVWRAIPSDANRHPHAPWWDDKDGSLARLFDGFALIPRAQLVGLLYHFGELVPTHWLETITEETVIAIETLEQPAFGGGGDGLRYALDVAETDTLPQRYKDRLRPRLHDLARRIVSREPEEWDSYSAKPLKVAPSPQSIAADVLWDELQRNLDYEIARQTREGTWEPTWTWGEDYLDAWGQAKQDWRGHLTLETLTSLSSFGRLGFQVDPTQSGIRVGPR